MPKIIAINGSPRKNNNTATLLTKALEGAQTQNVTTQIVNLYDLNFKGCTSCFACKLKNSKFIGKCAMQDDLTQILEQVMQSDILLLGSPIYFSNITSSMRAFLERLIYPNYTYDSKESPSVCPTKISSAFIYILGASLKFMQKFDIEQVFTTNDKFLKVLKGSTQYMLVEDTYQFNDYSKYATNAINEQHKKQKRQEQFPIDCQKAFDLGKSLIQNKK